MTAPRCAGCSLVCAALQLYSMRGSLPDDQQFVARPQFRVRRTPKLTVAAHDANDQSIQFIRHLADLPGTDFSFDEHQPTGRADEIHHVGR